MQKILELQPKDFMKGLATGEYINDGLFSDAKDIDVLTEPYGLLKAGYGKYNLNTFMSDIIISIVVYDNDVYGYGDDGYLYEIFTTSANVLDSGNESGRAGGRNSIVYKNKLHYFYNGGCGTYNFSSTFNNTAYTTNITNDPHPATEFQDVLYFGNGQYLGEIDNTTLNAQKLNLGNDYRIQDVEIYNNYIAILATKNNTSKLFLWNGYSDKMQYEYSIDEKCTALEKYKTTLAVFGEHLMLFNGGSFDTVRKLDVDIELHHNQTTYKDGVLYYIDKPRFSHNYYYLYSYGALTSGATPVNMSMFYKVPFGNKGAIFINGVDPKSIFISGNTSFSSAVNSLYNYHSTFTASQPEILTKFFELEHTGIQKISMSFKTLESGDGVTFTLMDNNETIITLTVNYTNDGAINYKEWIIATKPINNAQIKLIWDSNSKIKIENITLYGDRKKRPA